MPISPITSVANIEHQKKTNWDFYFLDNIYFKYRIKTATLPLPKFEIETRHTWENFYKELKINTTFDIEIYEDIGFLSYRYFQIWRSTIYNMYTRQFISYPPNTPNPIFKTAIFQYYSVSGVIDTPPNKVFVLENVKLVGIGDLTNDYEDGGPLVFTVTLCFENLRDF